MARNTAEFNADRQWYIVGRWQEFEGEGRANLLRMIAIGVFYAIQLVHFFFFLDAAQRADEAAFQRTVTYVAAAWSFSSLAVLICLQSRIFPAGLKYASTAIDLALVTSLACLGSGPASPLVLVFFLIVALASLRLSLGLIWFASLGGMLGYLTTIGVKDKHWFDADHVVRPIEQFVTLASLALTGVVLGQVVRRVRWMANEYAARLQASTTESGR